MAANVYRTAGCAELHHRPNEAFVDVPRCRARASTAGAVDNAAGDAKHRGKRAGRDVIDPRTTSQHRGCIFISTNLLQISVALHAQITFHRWLAALTPSIRQHPLQTEQKVTLLDSEQGVDFAHLRAVNSSLRICTFLRHPLARRATSALAAKGSSTSSCRVGSAVQTLDFHLLACSSVSSIRANSSAYCTTNDAPSFVLFGVLSSISHLHLHHCHKPDCSQDGLMLLRELWLSCLAVAGAYAQSSSVTPTSSPTTASTTAGTELPSTLSYLSYSSTITLSTTTGASNSSRSSNSTAPSGSSATSESLTLIGGGRGTATATGNGTRTAGAPTASNTQPCNNYPELCQRSYGNITEVCAHNSPFVKKGNAASNQMLDVTTQLDDGIRMCKSRD